MDSATQFDLVVIGGGAAGFYGAIQAAERKPGMKILILEKSNKVLSKVKISGGGRCNVTHDCESANKLAGHYPRGEKFLKQVFRLHSAKDTLDWFNNKGVSVKIESDGRMFPVTDDSQTIIDCFMNQIQRHKIKLELGEGVESIEKSEGRFTVRTLNKKQIIAKSILVATGGHPNASSYDWLRRLGLNIVSPIPSLFTFNDSDKKFTDLMGLAVQEAEVRIVGTKFLEVGPVLITHWGLSGPAVIKLSAWAAKALFDQHYSFSVLVSWIGPFNEDDVRNKLALVRQQKGKQKVMTNPQFGLPARLWTRLCELADIESEKVFSELSNKSQNRLMEFLIRCPFAIKGKTTFKDEFVTCGGVDLAEVNPSSMESYKIKDLYFAGEVLNIDGETGGFNFQAAWSTSFVAAMKITQDS